MMHVADEHICVYCGEHTDNVLVVRLTQFPWMTTDFWVCGKCLNFERLQELDACALNACRLKLMSN